MSPDITDCTENERDALRHGVCPDCGNNQFLGGPTAGLCQNIKCIQCYAEFNVGPLVAERLTPRKPPLDETPFGREL